MEKSVFACTLPELLNQTVQSFPERLALTFVKEEGLSYAELQSRINIESAFLRSRGVEKGDRVAILSQNMPEWTIAYFGILSIGAVAVPVLPDFTAEELSNILEHSGSKLIYVGESLNGRLEKSTTSDHLQVLAIEEAGTRENIVNSEAAAESLVSDDLAAIIYTSGTTGRSKGVMLSHGNICSNVRMAKALQAVDENDRMLSILPLSHTLENTVCLLIALASGSSVHYLRKPPTAPVLLPALQIVKPTIMLTVPLIMEKIFKAKVLPSFTKSPLIRRMYAVRPIQKALHKVAGKKLMKTFGGELHFYGIGGAKLDSQVEQFLLDAKFPYAIGYGLTETSPLLAGATPGKTRLGSTGPACEGVELKIHEPDKHGQGEIWARGPNVMKGYYKEPELTAEVLTEDGWFKTGDLGSFDAEQNLYIRGRSKSLILGSSGENIYPEDIESVINGFRHVVESLVVQQKGKLVALVHFNKEEIEEKYQHLKEQVHDYAEHKLDELQKELQDYVNSRVNKFSRLQLVMVQHEPFQRTATQKIKRFLYQG